MVRDSIPVAGRLSVSTGETAPWGARPVIEITFIVRPGWDPVEITEVTFPGTIRYLASRES